MSVPKQPGVSCHGQPRTVEAGGMGTGKNISNIRFSSETPENFLSPPPCTPTEQRDRRDTIPSCFTNTKVLVSSKNSSPITTTNEDKFILDACCGPRGFWLNKQHPNALYIDIRKEGKGFIAVKPNCSIDPDIVADFRDLYMFEDQKFKLIVWDPPHFIKEEVSHLEIRQKYGCLHPETWPYDLKKGFNELWWVLDDFGVLIFKWSEYNVKSEQILKLFHTQPLFGQTTKKNSTTKWFCFMKIPKEASHV